MTASASLGGSVGFYLFIFFFHLLNSLCCNYKFFSLLLFFFSSLSLWGGERAVSGWVLNAGCCLPTIRLSTNVC